jgi:hypothetical protein
MYLIALFFDCPQYQFQFLYLIRRFQFVLYFHFVKWLWYSLISWWKELMAGIADSGTAPTQRNKPYCSFISAPFQNQFHDIFQNILGMFCNCSPAWVRKFSNLWLKVWLCIALLILVYVSKRGVINNSVAALVKLNLVATVKNTLIWNPWLHCMVKQIKFTIIHCTS